MASARRIDILDNTVIAVQELMTGREDRTLSSPLELAFLAFSLFSFVVKFNNSKNESLEGTSH